MRVTIFDYGAGNLHSLCKAIAKAEADVVIESDPRRSVDTDVLVLPGVGAFGPAAERMSSGATAMRAAIAGGLPTLGICLGMQLFFNGSDEGRGAGLGIIPGRVTPLRAKRRPQIGWNTLEETSDALLERAQLSQAYYANGFVCRPDATDAVTAWSTHETDRFPAVVRSGAAVGVQFHPEKSSAAGVRFIAAFLAEARR